MRVQFQVSGGIGFLPGLAAPRAIDVDALPDDDRRRVERAVDEARFFTLPARVPAPRGAADFQTYHVTIEDGPRRHTVVVSDPVAPAPLQKLINVLRSLGSDLDFP
jgi:emfourin